ncbi:HlyD family efflux transporter periplasmic adaptor subunit [Ferrimonas sediminicola]|uniref:HlyD family efflux transporter periplasmic adaptor subunit n=1 Tax=Ferrimonas sediminicola TaxID=2569538 RepID=A0A4U1BGT0_9GAMM|nr:HlyD family efflux transporter periplasmic adaptor subunit [Ferrimonas sediminicola]TKB50435.1 HlyD family efflux transporter periplasmic adaptor subunit [Ferrimonas sediminicola]
MIQDTSGQDVTRQRRPKRRWLAPAIGLSLVLASSGYLWASYGQGQQSISGSRLQLATVERGDMIREIAVRGRIVAANAPVIYSPSAGRISLKVQPGQLVETGQPLAMIESPELESELSQEQAVAASLALDLQRRQLDARRKELELQRRLDQAKVKLVAAEREKRRADKAAQTSLISDIDHQQAQDEFASAKIAFEHAEQEIALAHDTLKFEHQAAEVELQRQNLKVAELSRQVDALGLRAPLSGLVGNTLVEEREQVAANQALLSVVSLTDYQAELEVPESYADELGLTMPVTLSVGGQALRGEIAGISPEIVANQVKVRVSFDGSDLRLRQNQRLTAQIQLESLENVLMVRRGAFIQSGQSRIAYRVEGQLARKTPLSLGATSLTHVEVVDGLRAGDQIIISDLSGLLKSSEIIIK